MKASTKIAVRNLRRKILLGIKQANSGKTTSFNDESLRQIMARGRVRRNRKGSAGR